MESTTRSSESAVFATPLASHGLDPEGVVHWNLKSNDLHNIAVERGEAQFTAHNVLLATTGERTGRSPNDRFIVDEPGLADQVWWGSVNKSTSRNVFEGLLEKVRIISMMRMRFLSKTHIVALIPTILCQFA